MKQSRGMQHLGELFNKYGSDKDRNGYTAYYDSIFKNIRDRPINFLEIGIGTMIPGVHSSMVGYSLAGYKPGGSLRAWRDYFANGTITGVDVQPDTQFTEDRIKTYLSSSTDRVSLDRQLRDEKFDIILDDGSHAAADQLATMANLWWRVKPGGYYIIEDINGWSTLPTTDRPAILAIAGPDTTLLFSENKNIAVISKVIR